MTIPNTKARDLENIRIRNDILFAPKNGDTRTLAKSLSQKYQCSLYQIFGNLKVIANNTNRPNRHIQVIIPRKHSVLN